MDAVSHAQFKNKLCFENILTYCSFCQIGELNTLSLSGFRVRVIIILQMSYNDSIICSINMAAS